MRPFGFFSTLAPAGVSINATYQIDFGDDLGGRISPAPWNNYDDGSVGFIAGTSLSNLTDTDSNVSGIEVAITQSFTAVNGAGAADDPANNPYPHSATRDGFEVDNGQTATIEFRNLDPTKQYIVRVFGARAFIGGTTDYQVIGGTTETISQDNRNNGNGQAYITTETSPLSPDGSNIITMNVDGTASDRGYLNVVELIEINP